MTEWAASTEARRDDWVLYSHAESQVPPAFTETLRVLPGDGGTRWEQWTLGRALARDEPDVLFAPAYTAPLRARCPVAVTVHDVSFFAHPEWFPPRQRFRRQVLTRLAATRARLVLTDSTFSRGEIVRHLRVPVGRIRVVLPGMGVRRAIARDRRKREPLVLFAGSIFRRRHVDSLIRAFGRHVAPRVPASTLEIVGENRAYPPLNLEREVSLLPLEVQRRIAIRSYVDEDTLMDLYERASAFAFPSEYEGFGLTPVEALAAGVPPVVLDTPVAVEICGPAARYVQNGPALGADLGNAIVQLLTSDIARQDVLRYAPEVLARYQWGRAAAETLAVLHEAGSD